MASGLMSAPFFLASILQIERCGALLVAQLRRSSARATRRSNSPLTIWRRWVQQGQAPRRPRLRDLENPYWRLKESLQGASKIAALEKSPCIDADDVGAPVNIRRPQGEIQPPIRRRHALDVDAVMARGPVAAAVAGNGIGRKLGKAAHRVP